MRLRLTLLILSLLPASLPGQDSLPVRDSLPAHDSLPTFQEAESRIYPCADTVARDLPDSSDEASAAQARSRADRDWKLARLYAPILRFAPGERYYPTIPFFTAFSDSNYVVARQGVADTTAAPGDSILGKYLAKRGTAGERLASYAFLRDQYQRLDRLRSPHRQQPAQATVVYRVCGLAAARDKWADSADWSGPADAIWRYLRSDEQSWDRFGLDTLSTGYKDSAGVRDPDRPARIRDVQQFRVVQYFFYYVADWGLLGHAHDIEFAFVFVPRDTIIAKRFRIVVGAGHDPPAPNNVLVYTGFDAAKAKHFNQNILVELGGHSSAPDMPPFGQFSAGLDVNWHIDDVWGTRDEQATGGISFSGRYEGTMTYPRDPEDALTFFPKHEALASSTDSMLRGLVRIAPDLLASHVVKALKDSKRDSVRPIGRLRLADSIIEAYQAVDKKQESAVSRLLGVQAAEGKLDVEMVDDSLQLRRRKQQIDTVHAVLRASNVGLGPSLYIVKVLDLQRQRVPHDSLRLLVAGLLPPDLTPEDRIADEVYKLVEERIKPSYSLIPAEYLQRLTAGAVARDVERVQRYLRFVARFLHDAECEDEECRAPNPLGPEYPEAFRTTVCAPAETPTQQGPLLPKRVGSERLACELERLPPTSVDSLLDLMALWDDDLWDGVKRIEAHRHKVWQRPSYVDPGGLFRSELFRPTVVQTKTSRHAALKLFTLSTTYSDHTLLPAVGFIFPAFRSTGIPVRVPGYLEIQLGPYIPMRGDDTQVRVSLAAQYDRQFAYFWGWFVKAQYVFGRRFAHEPTAGSNFTVSAGPSFWTPSLFGVRFFRWLHFRPGLRLDTEAFRPSFGRVGWDLQLEYRR